jgi:hypothetical protein
MFNLWKVPSAIPLRHFSARPGRAIIDEVGMAAIHYFSTALLAHLLFACAADPVAIIYKQGTMQSERQAALDGCKIASFKEIPQNIATAHSPGYFNPGTLNCTTIGYSTTCNRIGAVNIPSSSTNYDVNEDLRIRYVVNCMRRQGYFGDQAERVREVGKDIRTL